jgi:hypothetical protein
MINDSNRITSGAGDTSPGPFLAKVIGHLDSTYMGILEVELLRPVGNDSSEGQVRQVKYLSPFYGVTSTDYVTDTNDYNNTQKSYGFWAVPPDVGTIVMTIFVDGDPRRGYWIGCVPDENMNFMLPGLAATSFTTDGDQVRQPVAEYNKVVNDTNASPNSITKPPHPLATALKDQGLLADDTRGITTSSARREVPSMVFGISTPGPVDKNTNAKKGAIGKKDSKVANAFVSRLGGSTFVMDDGDDKFLRKTDAGNGPPEYLSVENAESGGNVNVPHNDLIRLRTRTGHQILLHNSEDLIYIGNAKGTTWIELTSNGKIDIFASDSISVHTKQDINFLADRDINLEAGRNVNIKATKGRVQVEATTNFNLIIGKDGVITTKGNLQINTTGLNNFTSTSSTNIKSSAKINLTSAADINFKAGAKLTQNASGYYSLPGGGGAGAVTAVAIAATTATALSTFDNVYNDQGGKVTSIMKRVPNVEPWAHHENLDPLFMTSSATDREDSTAIKFTDDKVVPKYYKQYSTKTDTFNPPPPPKEQK